MVKVRFKKLHPDAQLPKRAKPGDAGMDITCVDEGTLSYDLSQITYNLGLAMEIPQGYVGYLFPRSSICKTSLDLSNSVGVIDSGYRGEVKAVFNRRYHKDFYNHITTDDEYEIARSMNIERRVSNVPYKKGDRIVQLVVMPIPEVETEWADELSDSERGQGGFGSTGK